MISNESNPYVNINAFHLDNIGKLYVLIDFYYLKNIAEKFKQDKIKIFNKCEDGNLDIKIKLNEICSSESTKEGRDLLSNTLNLKIFLSNSLSPKLNATKFILNSNCINDATKTNFERLTIVYSVNANIFNKNNLYEKSAESLRITDCFDKINIANESNIQEPFYLKSIKKINCRGCKTNLYDLCEFSNQMLNNIKVKIIENFDFDYVDKLENLSCHESHTEDIIPNIEEKLKMRININDHYIQINKYLREITGANSNLIFNKKNNIDYAFCKNCSSFIGFIDNLNDKKYEFLNIILNSVIIEDEEDNTCEINMNRYFKYRILKSLSENLIKIHLVNRDEISLKDDLDNSFEKKENFFLEITKNVVNIATTISLDLFDCNTNQFTFDNTNIKRALLIHLINSNSTKYSNTKEAVDFKCKDCLNLIEEKSLLFLNKSEKEDIFNFYRMPNNEINRILRDNPVNSKIDEYFICEI